MYVHTTKFSYLEYCPKEDVLFVRPPKRSNNGNPNNIPCTPKRSGIKDAGEGLKVTVDVPSPEYEFQERVFRHAMGVVQDPHPLDPIGVWGWVRDRKNILRLAPARGDQDGYVHVTFRPEKDVAKINSCAGTEVQNNVDISSSGAVIFNRVAVHAGDELFLNYDWKVCIQCSPQPAQVNVVSVFLQRISFVCVVDVLKL